jgi:hypothetical protein
MDIKELAQAKTEFTVDKAKDCIINAMRQNGQYTHNIISLNLRRTASLHGTRAANQIIEDFNLEGLYNIPPA